jgi:hypothetical protein
MQLTNRDMLFMKDLYYVKYLNSNRIGKIFGNYNSGIRRMKILEENSYIKNIDYLVNGEKVFCLTKKGANIINVDYNSIGKTDKLAHALACSDFYFYLKSQGHPINYFSIDEQITYKFQGKSFKFRPDVVLDADRWYFVEMDLSNKRIEEKVYRWENYYKSMCFKARFELFPPIVFVSNNINKIKNIVEKAKSIDINYAFKDIVEITNNNYQYHKELN